MLNKNRSETKSRLLFVVLALAGLLGAGAAQQDATAGASALPAFNQRVLDLIAEYPTDGTHTYWWPRAGESAYDGGTRDLMLFGRQVMDGDAQGRTFCCGLTLEVFARAYEAALREAGAEAASPITADNWAHFQRLWFVLEKNGPGPSAALEDAGLGRTITAAEALPGDFVQIWRRTGSGHSVVFIEWVHDDAGEEIGMKYWSTQTSTKGIAENTEYWGAPDADKGMAREHTHFARVDLAPVLTKAATPSQ